MNLNKRYWKIILGDELENIDYIIFYLNNDYDDVIFFFNMVNFVGFSVVKIVYFCFFLLVLLFMNYD